MEIDASDLTTSICETLLVTTIVSDWNTRAWTFLEAFRARRNIHLLCKNNVVVSLKQIIQQVYHEGALDIGILLLAVPHFLPPFDDRALAEPKSESRVYFEAGYLPIETSGILLSHRPASRAGDDIVIWSLLISERSIFYGAEAFWRSLQGPMLQTSEETGRIFSRAAQIKTGYLVSNAPRLKATGLGWAPVSPTLHASVQQSEIRDLDGFDGGESAYAYITTDGLVGDWLLWKFNGNRFQHLSNYSQYSNNLAEIKMQYLQGYRWGAILCPILEQYNGDVEFWWEEGGRTRSTVVVICGTNETNGSVVEGYTYNSSDPKRGHWDKNNDQVGWEWRGVYVWDNAEPLPKWRKVKNFLVV